MRRVLQVLSAFVALAMVGSVAHAQSRMRPPSIAGIWNPAVGSGATYEMDKGNGKNTMEVAIVGKDSVNGKDAYWMEISFMPAGGEGEIVMKTLYYRDGDDMVITHRIMQMPGMPPMEFPDQMLGRMQQANPQIADIRKESEEVGSESVTTPAGTFDCEHYKMKDGSGEFWIKDKTGPWGLVKSVSKDSTTMVLTRVFTDAKDKITEKPVPFNPMGMGRPPQP
jgi:hypothetical protein